MVKENIIGNSLNSNDKWDTIGGNMIITVVLWDFCLLFSKCHVSSWNIYFLASIFFSYLFVFLYFVVYNSRILSCQKSYWHIMSDLDLFLTYGYIQNNISLNFKILLFKKLKFSIFLPTQSEITIIFCIMCKKVCTCLS